MLSPEYNNIECNRSIYYNNVHIVDRVKMAIFRNFTLDQVAIKVHNIRCKLCKSSRVRFDRPVSVVIKIDLFFNRDVTYDVYHPIA